MKRLPLLIVAALALPACSASKTTPTAADPAGVSETAADPSPSPSDADRAVAAGLASPRFRTVDDFSLGAITRGEDFTLSRARAEGQWVALHFLLLTDCPLCLTYTMRFHDLGQSQPNVKHVFIKPDDPRIAQRWVRMARAFTNDQVPPIHRDPDAALAHRLDVKFGHRFHGETCHYPCLVLIDPKGRERWRYTGTSTFDRATVRMFTDAYDRLAVSD